MKIDKFAGVLIILTIVSIVGGIFLVSRMGKKVEVNPLAKAQVESTSQDWGEIKMNDGNKTAEFSVKNAGEGDLSLSNVVTSCMCTTAKLTLDGEESPEFGMHGESSYVMKVPAGKEAKLTVVFDPAFHGPSGVGPITRQIKISTNDAAAPQLNFTLTGNVIN
jgi:hypothetical protein